MSKKAIIENLVGLDRYAEISGVPFDTLQAWKDKAIGNDHIMVIIHGEKLYGKGTYNGVRFVFIYGRAFIDVNKSKLSEKHCEKYSK